METSAISHRVADFLEQYPPFQSMAEGDLIELAARGRVRFHEPNEYIVWQGEPHKQHVFVIQQGTVSLWDEAGQEPVLRDVRGPGDLLGVDRFSGAPHCLHSARSATDVLLYAFPAWDFEQLLAKYPHARQFVEAQDTVPPDYQWATDAPDLQQVFLHDVAGQRTLDRCDSAATIRSVAEAMVASGAEAMAVVDAGSRLQSVVTVGSLLGWIAAGAGNPDQPIAGLTAEAPLVVGSAASVIDGMLALSQAGSTALALTADGTPDGTLQALVTAKDIGRVFGDQPMSIIREIRRATGTGDLRSLNHRTRAFAQQYLTSAISIDWLARAVSLADAEIVRRIISLEGAAGLPACWCLCGASGRGESITRQAPQLAVIVDDEAAQPQLQDAYSRVTGALAACDFLTRSDLSFDRSFLVATTAEWQGRYTAWLRDPVRAQMHLARPLFDLRPVHGPDAPWHAIERTVAAAVDRDLLFILANDSLSSLPPLSFFQDAVVEESGEQTNVFRLEHSALQPLVDVGRLYGLATKRVLGSSTRERFAAARMLLPEHESIFREASETLRVLLWQQARIGISQGTTGSELPPTLLSRHDRQVLKGGFRAILRLLDFTGNSAWFAAL